MAPNFVDLWRLTGQPSLDAVSEVFHENSKIPVRNGGYSMSQEILEVTSEGFKSYRWSEQIPLPAPDNELPLTLALAINRRRSVRTFGDQPMDLNTLGTLLGMAVGQNGGGSRRRRFPSAGALFPLETYVVAMRNTTLAPGVYHYDVRAHALSLVTTSGVTDEAIEASFFVPEVASTATLLIVLTAMFGRTKLKYGERGYRFALLEAGHAAQNLCLLTEALDVRCCPIGGFVDDHVNSLLGVDGVEEAALYLLGIGSSHPTSGPDS